VLSGCCQGVVRVLLGCCQGVVRVLLRCLRLQYSLYTLIDSFVFVIYIYISVCKCMYMYTVYVYIYIYVYSMGECTSLKSITSGSLSSPKNAITDSSPGVLTNALAFSRVDNILAAGPDCFSMNELLFFFLILIFYGGGIVNCII